MSDAVRRIDDRVVGLSVGDTEELARLGYGSEHLDEVALRIVRCLLQLGCRIAFGGGLRPGGFADIFLELVYSERMSVDEAMQEARLYSYQPWPRDQDVTPERVARAIGLCHFVRVSPDLPEGQPLHPHMPNAESPRMAWQRARAYTRMRHAMTDGGFLMSDGRKAPALDARIVLGGRRTGFSGAMPGIVEESLYAVEAQKPLFVLGGFGGGAAALAEGLIGADYPGVLTLEHQREASSRFELMLRGFALHDDVEVIENLYGRLRSALGRVLRDPEGGLSNGLTVEENLSLMRSESVTEITVLLRRGLTRLYGSS